MKVKEKHLDSKLYTLIPVGMLVYISLFTVLSWAWGRTSDVSLAVVVGVALVTGIAFWIGTTHGFRSKTFKYVFAVQIVVFVLSSVMSDSRNLAKFMVISAALAMAVMCCDKREKETR